MFGERREEGRTDNGFEHKGDNESDCDFIPLTCFCLTHRTAFAVFFPGRRISVDGGAAGSKGLFFRFQQPNEFL